MERRTRYFARCFFIAVQVQVVLTVFFILCKYEVCNGTGRVQRTYYQCADKDDVPDGWNQCSDGSIPKENHICDPWNTSAIWEPRCVQSNTNFHIVYAVILYVIPVTVILADTMHCSVYRRFPYIQCRLRKHATTPSSSRVAADEI
jgi:hypothetical protein